MCVCAHTHVFVRVFGYLVVKHLARAFWLGTSADRYRFVSGDTDMDLAGNGREDHWLCLTPLDINWTSPTQNSSGTDSAPVTSLLCLGEGKGYLT